MSTLMIHEVNDKHIDIIKPSDILTFDDGLFSQYSYIDLIRQKNINNKLFFITPNLVYDKDILRLRFQDNNNPTCTFSMEQHFLHNNNFNYMTPLEVQYLHACNDIIIGAHSYYHDVILTNTPRVVPSWRFYKYQHIPENVRHLVSVNSMLSTTGFIIENGKSLSRTDKDVENYIREDTEKCLQWFYKYLKYTPVDYCFPFNSSSELLITILKEYGFKNFYGSERIPIESLL